MNHTDPNIIPFPGQTPQGAFVLRVDLVLAPGPIWRRLRIGDRATFWDLHVAIQDAMGWGHRHRHLFVVDQPDTGQRLRLGVPDASSFHGGRAVLPGWEMMLADIVRRDLPPFLYTYHLGEEWQHEVSLENVESAAMAGPTPACLDGAGACPAEGCGGPARYTQLIADGSLPAGGDFDPAAVVFSDAGLLWKDLFEPE